MTIDRTAMDNKPDGAGLRSSSSSDATDGHGGLATRSIARTHVRVSTREPGYPRAAAEAMAEACRLGSSHAHYCRKIKLEYYYSTWYGIAVKI